MSAVDVREPEDATPMARAARIAAMLEHPTLAVAVVERGRVRRSNAAWNALFAWKSDVSVESHLISLFPSANSADRFERALKAELASNGRDARVEHMLVKRDGVAFMAEAVVQVLDAATAGDGLAADATWQVRDVTTERELRREIRELEEYYRALSTFQWDLTFVVDRRDCLTFASPSVEAVLGYRPHAILGEPFTSLLAADGAMAAMQWLRAARQDSPDGLRGTKGPRETHRVRVMHRDGEPRVLACRIRNCVDVPRIAGLLINARDVTDEAREEASTKAAQERATRLRDRLFEVASEASDFSDERISMLLAVAVDELKVDQASWWTVDESTDVLTCTHLYRSDDVDGPSSGDLVGESFDPSDAPSYALELQARRPIVVDDVRSHAAIDERHRERLIASKVGALLDFPVFRDGRMAGLVSIGHDGDSRAWSTEEIDFGAGVSLLMALAVDSSGRGDAGAQSSGFTLDDPLTGVANRTQAEIELERLVDEAGRSSRSLAAAMIDVDEFRRINDAHGYALADRVLVALAQRLRAISGPDAVVARMGSDEFLVIRPELTRGATEGWLLRVLESIGDEPLDAAIRHRMGASIGVARFPVDADDAQSLLGAADVALAEAKRRGHGQVFAYDGALAERLRIGRELDAEIEGAFARDELCLFYQPQVDLARDTVVGLEALLRWQHPTRGLLLPDAFIDAALRAGLADTLTKWIFTQVCEQLVAWRRAGWKTEIPVSINVTGREFRDRRLPATVASALMKSALPARVLMLEVTEATLRSGDDTTVRVVKELVRLGVRVSIADVGLNAESVDALRRLPIAQMKMNRMLIAGLPDDAIACAAVDAVVQAAKQLEHQVVAEGVETAAQAEHLRARGCDAGQGFHLGAPLGAADTQRFLLAKAASRS